MIKVVTKTCQCNKCGVIAHAVSGKPHRRCSGSETPTPKRHKKPSNERGIWT